MPINSYPYGDLKNIASSLRKREYKMELKQTVKW